MHTMTSLEAQNNFGSLIDRSQREPVLITRRGRPVSVLLSFDDFGEMPFSVAQAISELSPLRGKPAGEAMRQTLDEMQSSATQMGLTEADVMQIVRDNRV
jgi:prevent-host-death family protein